MAQATAHLGAIQHVSEIVFERVTMCQVSVVNALCSHRTQYISFPPMGVTETSCKCAEYHLHLIKILSHFDLESSYTQATVPALLELCINE